MVTKGKSLIVSEEEWLFLSSWKKEEEEDGEVVLAE